VLLDHGELVESVPLWEWAVRIICSTRQGVWMGGPGTFCFFGRSHEIKQLHALTHDRRKSAPFMQLWWAVTTSAASPHYVAYYRVSTKAQGNSLLGLKAQRRSVRNFVRRGGGKILGEFTEIGPGHRPSRRRPSLTAAISMCQQSGAVLLVARLDRLARSLRVICEIRDANIQFVAADVPEANHLAIYVLAAVAEYERRLIGARVREALQAYSHAGGLVGVARLDPSARRAFAASGRAAQAKEREDFGVTVFPIIRDIVEAGAPSCADVARALNRRGISTFKGKSQWTGTAVWKMLRRLAPTCPLVQPGRQRLHASKLARRMSLLNVERASTYAKTIVPIVDELRGQNSISWHKLAKLFDERGIATQRRRSCWSPQTLKKIYERGLIARSKSG
jgi:DNA invertase Pin-like site-specific DNA recombinase